MNSTEGRTQTGRGVQRLAISSGRIAYNRDRVLVVVLGARRAAQGGREILRCGQQDIRKVFGEPVAVVDAFYVYPGFKLHCGTRQGAQRWVSAAVLGEDKH